MLRYVGVFKEGREGEASLVAQTSAVAGHSHDLDIFCIECYIILRETLTFAGIGGALNGFVER